MPPNERNKYNYQSFSLSVVRSGKSVPIKVEADLDGSIVAISKTTTEDGKRFVLDDNENNAARCMALNLIYPNQGWDRKAKRLLEIAKEFPQF